MKGGVFRGFITAMAGFVYSIKERVPIRATHYPDPVLSDPYKKLRRSRVVGKPRIRRVLKCEPGTISYHDKLVRHFGRRQADKFGRLIQNKRLDLLPTAANFAESPEWAFRS